MEEKQEQVVEEKIVEPKKEKKKCNKELLKLQEENKLLNDKLLRVMAEMQNMKRRYDEEISRIYKYDGENFIKKTLTVLDNFERAILMDDDNLEDEVSKFLNGFKIIYNNLKQNLSDNNVFEIECLNKEFNPECMEAVMTESKPDTKPGIVTEVMLKGYKYHEKVIRPAMVKVSE